MEPSEKTSELIDKVIDKGIEIFFKGVNMVENLIGRVFAAMVAIFILIAILTNWRFFV
jgi:hypothetical protein